MEITAATINTILSTTNTAKAISGYFRIIESFGISIDNLASAKLDTALRELGHARNANSDSEKKSALHSARVKFSEALSLERKPGRLTLAYLGLAMCFVQLGEGRNLKNILVEYCNRDFGGILKMYSKFYVPQIEVAKIALKKKIISKQDIGDNIRDIWHYFSDVGTMKVELPEI